jgi:RecB family exonuclease
MELTWKLSKSAINKYLQCPYAWYLTYVKKIRPPPSKPMVIGIKVHEALCKFYDYVEPDRGSYEYFFDILTFLEEDDDCEIFLDNFARFEAERYKYIKENNLDWEKFFKPLYKEEKLKSKKYGLSGYVDRIDQVEPGVYAVIDIKTGKFNKNRISHMRRELCIYQIMAEEDDKVTVPVTHIGGYFPRTNDVFIEKIKPVSMKATKKAIQKVKDGLANDEFPMKPSPLCKWCDHIENCERAWRN